MNDTIQTAASKRFQCRHIHTEGRRCGSASLRGEEFCYFHHTSRKPVANPRARRTRQSTFDLPLPEDRGAIQLSIGEVLRRIASNAIDPRRAGLLLYGLQIAALNLPPHKPSPNLRDAESPVEEVIADPTHGTVAPRFELPGSDAPHQDSLSARLLEALRIGREPEAIPQPAPITIPSVMASAAEESDRPRRGVAPPQKPGPHIRILGRSFFRRGNSAPIPSIFLAEPKAGAPFMTVSSS